MKALLLLLLAGCAAGSDWHQVGGDELPPLGLDPGDQETIEALWTGSAAADPAGSFSGTGQLSLRDLAEDIETCRVVFDVEFRAVNEACDTCLWAFDLERVGAMGEVLAGCDAAHEPDAISGTRYSLGYNADVLWLDEGEGWYRAGSGWFDADDRFRWEREEGFSDED